jgi:hypothetical protein
MRSIRPESQFEQCHVSAPAWQLAIANGGITLCVHPSTPHVRCTPTCKGAAEANQRVKGCTRCWSDSKAWATTEAWGLRHTFDLVARDKPGNTLAVEVKSLTFDGGKAPNSEFQRFVGQCVLATAVHDEVKSGCAVSSGSATRRSNATRGRSNGSCGRSACGWWCCG